MKLGITLVLSAVVLALAALVFWRATASDAPSPATSEAFETPHERVGAAAELPAIESDLRATPAAQDDGQRVAVDAVQTKEPPTRWTPTLLRVRVVSVERGDPVADERVALLRSDDSVDGHMFWTEVGRWHAEPGESPFTNEHGCAEFAVRPGVDYRAWALLHESFEDGVDVAALMQDEVREVVLTVVTEPDLTFCGRLVDAESVRAIPDGVIRFDVDGSQTLKPAVAVAAAHDGTFELRVRSWDQKHALATATGYGRVLFELARGHETRERAFEVRLSRPATLEVLVLDEARAGMEATIDVRAGWDREWSARTDADGRAVLGDLLANAPLKVHVRALGRRPRSEVEPLTLAPGEHRVIEIRVARGATIFGRVEDELRGPIAESGVALRALGGELTSTRTDEHGRFRVDDLRADVWVVALEAAELRAIRARLPDALVPQRTVEITPGRDAAEVVLRIERGLYVRGVVLGPEQRPAAACVVWDGSSHAVTDAAGRFSVGPMLPGSCTLRAGGNGSYAASPLVTAEAGDTNVVLHVPLGATLRGRVVDASGELRDAEIVLSERGDDADFHNTETTDGAWSFEALTPATYSLTATTADGLCCRRAGLELRGGTTLEDVELVLQTGAKLKLVRSASAALGAYDVVIGGETLLMDWLEPEESRVMVLPPGEVELRWRDDTERIASSRVITLAAGEERELVW